MENTNTLCGPNEVICTTCNGTGNFPDANVLIGQCVECAGNGSHTIGSRGAKRQSNTPEKNLSSVRRCVAGLEKVTVISDRDARDEAECFVDTLIDQLADIQRQEGENSQAAIEGLACMHRVQNMITNYNACRLVVHCEICRSSFLGMGPDVKLATEDAFVSLSAHTSKFHQVTG